mgnify:CR=1 FL=1
MKVMRVIKKFGIGYFNTLLIITHWGFKIIHG